MPTITTRDRAQIYYKDWGEGQPVVFSHGWPLTADAWEDQIVPIGASALLLSRMVRGSTLRIYPGAPHGLCATHKDQVNADLLAFLKA